MSLRSIMWFRRDLRLNDLPALGAAAADGAEVLPVFVVDPSFDRAGLARRAHLRDCLVALDAALCGHDAPGLIIRHGDPLTVIPALAEEFDASAVFVSRDFSPYGRRRDAAVADALDRSGRRLRGIGSPYAVEPGKVRKSDGAPYAVFTPFSKVWRATGWPEPAAPVPDDIAWCHGIATDPMPDRVDPECELPEAGEQAALHRWRTFLADGGATAYDDQRDLPAVTGTSRLSPDLKWGTIHPRTMLADLDASGSGERGHTVFSSELAWRDFYADVLFQRPETAWANLNPKLDRMELDTDEAAHNRFERWCRGETGFGIVDAGMRQLRSTGWMHNRVRMITASFLVKDLHVPWQWGAGWFMKHLVDGDIASNNHGWQWVAGTGTDAAPYFRVFNPTLQQERYDPTGEYVAKWAPVDIAPMVDHKVEREEALRRLQAATSDR